MLVRSTVLAAFAAATALAAGGTTATVVLSASDQGVSASAGRNERATAGAENGKSADAKGADRSAGAAETADVTLPACPADVKNHGAYVSSVAKDKAEDAEPGAHGELVSAAAQSDCGKPEGGDDAAEAGETEGSRSDAASAGKANASEKGKAGQKLGAARGKSAGHASERAAR